MRLHLKLSTSANAKISLNYTYSFTSAIYKLLQFGSPEFSEFLHDIGYEINGKKYKLFTFALRFNRFKIEGRNIRLITPEASLFISSPLIDKFIRNFVMGTFEKQVISVTNGSNQTDFLISQIESLSEPLFTDKMKFFLLSPMVLSTVINKDDALKQYYLRETDEEDINRVMMNNLLNKYKLLYREEIEEPYLHLEFDTDYLRKKKRITKKITINEYGKNPIDVIGLQAPFTISANPELIKVGYECGFGEKNSMGFGMAEIT